MKSLEEVDYPSLCVAKRTFRIGVQTLWLSPLGSYWVRCINRTYDSGFIPVPPERAYLWKGALS